MARKKDPVDEELDKKHPALMPKLAWQQLIMELMAEHGFKHKYQLAGAIDVCNQTMSRWLGKKPALPEPDSFIKVATFLKISEAELAARWASFIIRRYGAYPQTQGGAASDIREPAPAYDELELTARVKALEELDLKRMPVEMRPFLHQHRRELLEHVRETEETKKRERSRLKALLDTSRELFDSAADTARLRLPQGG